MCFLIILALLVVLGLVVGVFLVISMATKRAQQHMDRVFLKQETRRYIVKGMLPL